MESQTYMKNLDIPPKKLRMFLPKVKKLSPLEATKVLFYSPNRAAQVFYKAIKSAMANAKQTLKVSDDLLQFKLFTVEEGNKLKRYTTGSRGSAKPFKKRNSHIKIILTSKTESEAVAKTKKVEKAAPLELKTAELPATTKIVVKKSAGENKAGTVKKTNVAKK